MATAYADILVKILQMLQDTAGATYDKTTEVAYWIEESLKEFSTYDPHIVDVVFKIESRTGTTTSATSLTDATKDQFVAGDATDEKVVHNTTDNTWAVVLANSDVDVNTISRDIMASGDNYRIYNKRCWNERQIYIGDVTDYLWIDSVEYPVGQRRNFKVFGEVLEIDVDRVNDSDSTLTTPQNIDVLIRFAMSHVLSQLTHWDGELTAATAEGGKRIAIDGLSGTETMELGEQFTLENHRSVYIVNREVALISGAEDIDFYPPLEAAASDNDDITFVQSTLKPQHEELFCHLVAARAVLSDNIKYIDEINKGGENVYARYRDWGERKLFEVQEKLDRIKKQRFYERFPTA